MTSTLKDIKYDVFKDNSFINYEKNNEFIKK